MTEPYTPPEFRKSAFHCPHCRAYANHKWCLTMGAPIDGRHGQWHENALYFSICLHCEGKTIWFNEIMLFPDTSSAPYPNVDLPPDIIADYAEARSILQRSPRGAAALFRLCIQKLCAYLGESGKDINKDIASLVKKGLSPLIQKSLDIVRVVGNEAVHPGTIDLKDDPETAVQLAKLINIIADAMITQPKAIEELYNKIPVEKRKAIETRDGKP